MPRLRVATPQVTGKIRPSVTPCLSDADDLLVVDLLALEVALHQLVGVLRDLVHQLLAVLLGLGARARRGSPPRRRCRGPSPRRRRPSCRSGRSRRGPPARRRSGSRSRRRAAPKAAFSESSAAKKSARSRSSMLTKTSRARPSASARRQSRSVWTSTPVDAR